MPTSSDGVLTVTTRPYAAVGIDVMWANASVWRTTVTRTVGGQTVTVRSGDLAFTPGGSGYVQDNEAPLEGVASYRAYGYSGLGALLATSTDATIALASAGTAWLKSIADPRLSQQVTLVDMAEQASAMSEEFQVSGQSSPVVWRDLGGSSLRGDVTFEVTSKADFAAIRASLDSGVCLLQGSESVGMVESNQYLQAASLRRERPAIATAWAVDYLAASFVQVARPDTASSPLMVPGWSYDVRDAAFASYAAADAAFASYRALAKGP